MPQHVDPDVQDITDSTRAHQYFCTYLTAMGQKDDIAIMHFSKVDFVTAMRGQLPQSVLNGSVTFHDLLSSDLSLNRYYSKEKIKGILHKATEEQREAAFPRQQLCKYMGITEETYKEIDVDNKRRDSFVLLQTLFKNASSKWRIWGKNKVPHMLIIEELVNTLNTECLGEFLYDAAIVAVERDANVKEVPWIDRNTLPKEKRLLVSCTDPNRITVRAEYTLYPWSETHLGIKMRVEYDVAVVEDRLISYQDVYPTISFSTTHKGPTDWKRIRPYTFDMENTLPHPEKYKGYWGCGRQASGYLIMMGMEGKTFTAQSMLSSTPQEAQLPEPEAQQTVPDDKGLLNGMCGFFARIASSFRKIFHAIKFALFGRETNLETEQSAEVSSALEDASKTDDSSIPDEADLTPETTTSPQEQQVQQHAPVAEPGATEAVDRPCVTVAAAKVSKVGGSDRASTR